MDLTVEEHHAAIRAFMDRVKELEPERWAAMEEKYKDHTVLTASKWRSIRRRERSVGLLGASPSYISPAVGEKHGFESVYEREESD